MTKHSHRSFGRLRWILFVFVLWVFSYVTAWGSDVLSDIRVQTDNQGDIFLFSRNKVREFFQERPSAKILNIDLPNLNFPRGTEIAVAPAPSIRFMRVSQISNNPSVVRVSIVMQDGHDLKPEVRGDQLVLRNMAYAPSSFSPNVSIVTEKPDSLLEQRVNLQFQDEDVGTILNALAVKFNLRIVADAGVKGKITINAVDVPLRELLKNLLLNRNFQYSLKGRELTVVSLGQSSGRMARELLFKDLSLVDALQTLSKMMNLNLIIHESVKDKTVNFFVENLSLDELLDLLISTNELVKKPYNENTFIIMDKKEAKDYGKKQYRTFKLVNAEPSEIISSITGSKSLAERIDTSNMSINKRINALSVYETPENLELIARVIENMDEKLKQAVIELKLLEINRSSLKQLGITLEKRNVAVADIARIPKSFALPAALDFLENNNKARVLASPRVRAVHGKKASIHVGEVIPVPQYTYEVASQTLNTYERKTYTSQQVGITLNVTPEISRDNEISLELNTKVDSVIDINKDGQVHTSNKETNTFVRIKDGETVVLGGLISHNTSNTQESPSILNKIPLLRTLLTHAKSEERDSELIMLVTPHLVNLDPEIDGPAPQKTLYIGHK